MSPPASGSKNKPSKTPEWSSLAYFLTLKIESTCCSETSVISQKIELFKYNCYGIDGGVIIVFTFLVLLCTWKFSSFSRCSFVHREFQVSAFFHFCSVLQTVVYVFTLRQLLIFVQTKKIGIFSKSVTANKIKVLASR
jgi:hypothetical protein